MALIKVGSMRNFKVNVKDAGMDILPGVQGGKISFAELAEARKGPLTESFEVFTSTEERGLGLHSIKLTEGFEGFLQGFLNPTNEVYFIAWAWDLSGEGVYQYPGVNVSPQDVLIPMRVGNVKEFIGQGIDLFPKRNVKGGIAVRIQVWESDARVRNFGKAITQTADAINGSGLNQLLTLVSNATSVTGTTLMLIKEAALELAKVIGVILQANGDDYVDLFEGYYASDYAWNAGEEAYVGNSSVLTLNKY